MIVCFSGTGNSRHVAMELSRMLGMEVVEMNRASFATASSLSFAYELNVWVFPIHSWGIPDFVVKFIERASTGRGPVGGSRHYMVCTCGDDIGLAHEQWRRLMRRKGWTPMAAYSVRMPNTYVTFPGFDVDTPEVAKRKIEESSARIKSVASWIKSGSETDDVVCGAMPWVKSRVIYPFFMKRMISPKPFRVDASLCIGCGKCEKSCPLGNVALDGDRRPSWGDDCTLCLGCYHVCPVHAVRYGKRLTEGKGQYMFS